MIPMQMGLSETEFRRRPFLHLPRLALSSYGVDCRPCAPWFATSFAFLLDGSAPHSVVVYSGLN